MGVLGVWALSYARGTPVIEAAADATGRCQSIFVPLKVVYFRSLESNSGTSVN